MTRSLDTSPGTSGSQSSQGPGWWLATDGQWYPPEAYPSRPSPVPVVGLPARPDAAQPDPGQTYQPATAPTYPGQQTYYQHPPISTTNGLSIAALVFGLIPFIPILGSIVAIIFGAIARSQIMKSGGRQGGKGMALAGIILGALWIAFVGLIFVVSLGAAVNSSLSNSSAPPAADVTISNCTTDSLLGTPEAMVSIFNHSSKPSDYTVTVAFNSVDGKTQVGTGTGTVQDLAPGQTTTAEALSLTSASSAFSCSIVSVDRTASAD